jgi:transcriptional regulator GlxA family with amidase domain
MEEREAKPPSCEANLATMASPSPPVRIDVLAYDGCLGSEVFGIVDLLMFANRIAAALDRRSVDLFRVSLVGRRACTITTAGGVEIRVARRDAEADELVVPGFEVPSPTHVERALGRWRAEIAQVASVAASGAPVSSVCVGAFLLGEAGLLDGRRATTSWLFADVLQSRYTRATVDSDLMIVSDGPVTTTAAFSAVNDLALKLIRTYAGQDLCRRVARLALVADNRNSQAPYVDDSLLEAGDGCLSRPVKRWLVERLAEPYDLGALAEAFHVSTRTLLRRFAEETGQTPLAFLQQARVDTAKRLLESPEHNLSSAIAEVGYTDITSFRRLFTKRVGMTPSAYRRQFRQTANRGPRSERH